MTIKSLEIQRMVVQAAKNIAFLQQNDINVFASVPARVKIPYVKLLALNFAPVKEAADLQRVAVSLFVATEGKNNVLLLNIVEALYNHLPSGLDAYCGAHELPFEIVDIYDANFTINEDLKNAAWTGNYTITLDIR